MRKVLIRTIILLIILSLASLVLSYFFPGQVPFLDRQRMKIQKPVMKEVGDYEIGEVYIENGELTEGPEDISYDELTPWLKQLQPGNIFVTNSRRYLSSEFIPGDWKHSGIFLGTKDQMIKYFGADSQVWQELNTYYKGKENQYLVLDSSSEGITIRKITRLSNMGKVSYLTNFAAFRILKNKKDIETFILAALANKGKDYDYDLRDDDTSAFYCSELIVHSLRTIDIQVNLTSETAGRTIISPDNLVAFMSSNTSKDKLFSNKVKLSKNEYKIQNSPF